MIAAGASLSFAREVGSSEFISVAAGFSLLCLCKKVAVLLCFPKRITTDSRIC